MPRKQRFKPSRKPKPVDSQPGDSQRPSGEAGPVDHGNPGSPHEQDPSPRGPAGEST